MIRASFWQWDRHQKKQVYIQQLNSRLQEPVQPIAALLDQIEGGPLEAIVHRRILVSGTFDFAHEIVLRNRRLGDDPGVFVLTPLRLEGSAKVVLVNRGFVPLALSAREERLQFQRPQTVEFTGLIKESVAHRWLAPRDPESGRELPWVDAWLRVDIASIQKQLPYPLLPIWLEIMDGEDLSVAQGKMVESRSGRDELLFLGGARVNMVQQPITHADRDYPLAVYDSVIPPGRHLGYVYEWAFMALITVLIGIILQLRPRRSAE